MENFTHLDYNDLTLINGGVDGNYIFAGAVSGLIGVGLIAAAVTPGVNVVAAAALAYGGTWAGSLAVTSTIYGAVN